jgi:hypothetical protein
LNADSIDEVLAATEAPASARWGAFEVWLRHHPHVEPWVVTVGSENQITAAALLTRELRAGVLKFDTATLPGEPNWLPALDSASASELARAISQGLNAIHQPWLLHIRNLPDPDPVVTALCDELAVSTLEPGIEVPRLYFAPGEPLNRYLSHNTRSAVAKARNRIDGAGLDRQLAWTSDEAEVDKALPEIVDVCWRRNHQLGRGSGVAEAGELALFTDIVHTNARAGRVRLLTHRFSDSLAAYALCFQTAGNLWVFSNSVSPDWLNYSAGTITNAEVVKAAHEDPTITCVDWGGGSQRYKLSGEAKLVQLQNLDAWSSRATRLGLQGFQIGRRKLNHLLAERSARH